MVTTKPLYRVFSSYEFEFDENGSCIMESFVSEDSFGNGSVAEYHEDGYVYIVTYTYSDGTKTVRKYDENGNIVSETNYDADGNRSCVGECDLSSTDNGDGTHTQTCADCDYELTEAHAFGNGKCVCGAEIAFTGII